MECRLCQNQFFWYLTMGQHFLNGFLLNNWYLVNFYWFSKYLVFLNTSDLLLNTHPWSFTNHPWSLLIPEICWILLLPDHTLIKWAAEIRIQTLLYIWVWLWAKWRCPQGTIAAGLTLEEKVQIRHTVCSSVVEEQKSGNQSESLIGLTIIGINSLFYTVHMPNIVPMQLLTKLRWEAEGQGTITRLV